MRLLPLALCLAPTLLLADDTTSHAPQPLSTAAAVEAAMFGAHRSDENVARNRYRHPVGTLDFFGLKTDQTVIEISPGGGWYAEILGPVLNGSGQYIAAHWDPDVDGQPDYRLWQIEALAEKFEANPELFDNAKVQPFSPPASMDLGESNSADLVVTFRNAHGWINGEIADDVFAEVFDTLKPGGTFGVVQHRGKPDADLAATSRSGYLSQDKLIALIESVGFELVATSEVNGNPKDTADWDMGVWTLPPSLRTREDNPDQSKYIEIGESDRMTLKFAKPADA